jgi:hypothetical protein
MLPSWRATSTSAKAIKKKKKKETENTKEKKRKSSMSIPEHIRDRTVPTVAIFAILYLINHIKVQSQFS